MNALASIKAKIEKVEEKSVFGSIAVWRITVPTLVRYCPHLDKAEVMMTREMTGDFKDCVKGYKWWYNQVFIEHRQSMEFVGGWIHLDCR